MNIKEINKYLNKYHLILDDSVHNKTGTYYLRDIDFKSMNQLRNRIEYERYSITFIEADNLNHIKSIKEIDNLID
jgi:hypothetical protein